MIRPYLNTDRTACLQIFKGNCPQYFDLAELTGFERWLTGQDQNKLAYQHTEVEKYFVIEAEKQVVGCGGYYLAAASPTASMTWGMIHADFHKQGLGQQLFQYRLEELHAAYLNHEIALDTSQHTFRFFERFGFEVTSIKPNGYGVEMDRYDMLFKR